MLFNSETSLRPLIYRLKQGSKLGKQAIAKAVGTNSNHRLQVIDATAGLGTDAIILAYLNCQVFAIEHNPLVIELLQNRLLKAKEDSFLSPIIKNITLLTGDAKILIPKIIKEHNFLPDVIYLDPMFPNKKNRAASKKPMQILQNITTNYSSENLIENQEKNITSGLLTISLNYAKKRIVVKRPRISPYLEELKPNFSLIGKANRFDVYLPKKY